MAETPCPRILIVDDEENLRLTLCQAFEMEGYEVHEAADSHQAVSLLTQEAFDVLLTDLMMPKIDGLSLLEKTRSVLPNAVIVLMTGQATVESAIRALKGGAFDYILKPFRLEEIFHVVARGLEQRRLRQENLELTEINRRLEEIDRIKSDLLSAVTHEFRTPLTIIYGWLELLLSQQFGSLNPEQRESLLAIREGSRRLGHLVSNVLTYVEHDRGAVDVGGGQVSLLGLLESILEELEGTIRDKRLKVEVRPGPEGLALSGNPEKLRLLFFNLLENAVKFNEPDAQIILSAAPLSSEVEVSVVNTHGAIAPERLDRLTAPFTQGDMSVTRGVGGLGLGLSVAKMIAAAHGGEIRLLSGRGQGTTVVVRLPRRQRC
ncbi:MAG: response regulator [Candidatus Methylomirabilales bacterium]